MGATKSKESVKTQRSGVDLSLLSARCDKVLIKGLQRTHDDYISRTVLNLLKAETFKDLLIETGQCKANLNELGIFKDVHVSIDVSKGDQATEYGYEVSFKGIELSRLTGSIGTEIGNNEGAATAEITSPNIFGRGERLSVHGSYSNNKTTDFNVKLSKPFYHTLLGDYKPETSLSLFKNTGSYPWSKYNTQDMGAILDFSFLMPVYLSHSFQYEWAVREIGTAEKRVPFFVRKDCGPRLASMFRHICVYDQRDSTIFPSQGLFIKMTNEMSGFGGNVSYTKSNTHGEINIPLFGGMSLQFCGRVGMVQENDKSPAVPISSLFTLGGPLTVRGFQTAGIGEHIEGAAVGAHTYWASGIHLWTHLPFRRHFGGFGENFRVHLFGNAGNVDSFSTDGCRTSIGAGIAFRLGERARIELNYCKPISKIKKDATKPEGFQFGIGYEFL